MTTRPLSRFVISRQCSGNPLKTTSCIRISWGLQHQAQHELYAKHKRQWQSCNGCCCKFGTTTTTLSMESYHRAMTTRLLNEERTWDDPTRLQACQTILWWTRHEQDSLAEEAIGSSWKIWERLVDQSISPPRQMDLETFHALLNYWRKRIISGRHGGAMKSPIEMLKLTKDYQSKGILQPSEQTYNMILSALGGEKQSDRREAPLVAEQVLYDMIENKTSNMPKPSITTFCSVMKVWISSGHPRAAQFVQGLENRRQELVNTRGWAHLEPNYIYKSVLIDAWAQAGQAEKAQDLLDHWIQECRSCSASKRVVEPPTILTFSSVLSAWSKPGKAEKADALLRTMINLYKEGAILKESPNIVSFSSVIDAWSKSKDPKSPERAEAVLRQAQTYGLKPNVISYTSVIHSYARRGKAIQALALLEEMIAMGIAPNSSTFNTILLVLAPIKARELLGTMRRLADTQGWDCAPDVISYTTVLQLFAKHEEDCEAAHEVWIEMMNQSNLNPDSRAYNAMLHVYAKTGKAQRAQELLEEMVRNYLEKNHVNQVHHHNNHQPHNHDHGLENRHPDHHGHHHHHDHDHQHRDHNKAAMPETASFNTVLSAWAKLGNISQAQALFDWMSNLHRAYRLNSVKPNVITYTNLLNCWAKVESFDEERVVKSAEDIFRVMEYDPDSLCRPNVVSCASLCKVYARFGLGDRAQALLRHMEINMSIEPNSIVYTHVMQALAEQCVKCQGNDPTIVDHVESLVEEMYQRKQWPTMLTYSAILKTLGASRIPDKLLRTQHVVDVMRRQGLKPNDVIQRQLDTIFANPK